MACSPEPTSATLTSEARSHKPFVLPQQDPTYYDSLLETYSVPELVNGPVPVSKSALARAARAKPSVDVGTAPHGSNAEGCPIRSLAGTRIAESGWEMLMRDEDKKVKTNRR